jgi:hypothetical protein
MKSSTTTLSVSTAVCALATCAHLSAQSVWLPAERQVVVTPGFAFTTFDEFWAGRTKVSNPPNGKSLDQFTGFLALEGGILPWLAADATLGYTGTDTGAFGGASDDGLADTQLGVRLGLVQESRFAPALTLRVGGVVAGTYDENTPFAAGDGAHALESSLQIGKRFGESGFGAYGEIGYRLRDNPAPDEIFGSVGVFAQARGVFNELDLFTISFGYRHVQGLNGLNIGGARFNPGLGAAHGFPALREVNQMVEGALGYTDAGGRHYQFTVAGSVDGRNTGDKLAFVFSVSVPFGGRD